MISYAGFPIHAPGNAEIAWARANIDPAKIWEFVPLNFLANRLPGVPFRPWLERPVEVGVLSWPTGASRFACFHGIVDSVQLASIRGVAFAGSTSSPQTLVIADGLHTLSTSMWMLPPRPLQAIAGSLQMWLITLVDDRYNWWFKSGSLVYSQSWASFFNAIGTALGVTIVVDPVPAAYLSPAATFGQSNEPLPVLLDHAALACGLRIVRQYDGTIRAQNALNGLAQAAANQIQTPQWAKKAGGQLLTADIAATLPSSLTFFFGWQNCCLLGTPAPLYTKQVTLTSLGLSELGGGPGVAGQSRPILSTAAANYNGGSPLNQSELDALAVQTATDLYRFQEANWDLVFRGPCPWLPESQSDLIEFTHRDGDISTRVQRGSWDNWPSALLQQSSDTTTVVNLSNTSFTLNNDYFNISNSTFTTKNVRNTYTVVQENLNSLLINSTSGNYGGLTINSFFEICGFQYWCCYGITSVTTDWQPPSPATVYPYTGGTATINTIIPVGNYAVPQLSIPSSVGSASTTSTVFPYANAGNDLIVQAFGHAASTPTPTLHDSQSNTFQLDAFQSDSASGLFCATWHSVGSGNTADSITVTTGVAPGTLNLIAAEVTNLNMPPTPASFGATGSSSIPSPGSVSPGSGNYLAFTMASADTSNPATIGQPAGTANYFQQLNGVGNTVGSVDYQAPNVGVSSVSPTYTTDQVARWAATAVVYPLFGGPQILAIVNTGTSGLTIKSGQTGAGKTIFLPPGYKDPVAGTWQLTLKTNDFIVLWYNACAIGSGADGWYVLYCSVSEFAVAVNGGNSIFEPHINLIPLSGVTINAADNAANLRTDVSIGFSGGSASYPLVRDGSGHSVAQSSSITFLATGNATATVSGSAGNASVTYNVGSGSSSITSGFQASPNGSIGPVASGSYGALGSPVWTLSVTLPATAQYMLWFNASWNTFAGGANGGKVFCRLWNSTQSAVVGNTADTVMIDNETAGGTMNLASGLHAYYTSGNAGDVIVVQAYTNGSGAGAENGIISFIKVP